MDLTGWSIASVNGNQSFTFPKFTSNPNSTVKEEILKETPM